LAIFILETSTHSPRIRDRRPNGYRLRQFYAPCERFGPGGCHREKVQSSPASGDLSFALGMPSNLQYYHRRTRKGGLGIARLSGAEGNLSESPSKCVGKVRRRRSAYNRAINSRRRTCPRARAGAGSLLRHPGLAQAGEVSGFVQGAGLRRPPPGAPKGFRMAAGTARFSTATTRCNGLSVVADYNIGTAPPLDILVVSGGPGWIDQSRAPETLSFIRRQAAAIGSDTDAVCAG